MKIAGIICEYNPFHNGHGKQLRFVRENLGEDCGIVCLMSGNFVQRGAPAVFDKSLRARTAIEGGADLVLELPIPYALSSAEGFASGGVSILSGICTHLSFGCETGTPETLMKTAEILLRPSFSDTLRRKLDTGISFPKARQEALAELGGSSDLLSSPNDILAVEYCKAILGQNSTMEILPVIRNGSYHAAVAETENPSATSLRNLIFQEESIAPYVPAEIAGEPHFLEYGERAILAKLRTMTDEEFEGLPYGSEGLWRKLMHNSRSCSSLEEILEATKSKRYTRTRLDRMVICAFLGITGKDMQETAPYTRVLAMNDRGREILKNAKKSNPFLNPGEKADGRYAALESRCGALYGLFAKTDPDSPDLEEKRRIYYKKGN